MTLEGWCETTVAALCDDGVLHTQTGPFGSQLHSYDYVPKGIPVVPTEAIGRRQLITEGIPEISDITAARLARHRLQTGDILFARRGVQATGLSAVVTSLQEGWICGTGAILLRIIRPVIDPVYLSFFLSSDETILWLKQHAVGAVMPNLNEGIIRQLPLRIPPISEQKTIGSILGALDEKIELNRRRQVTLEAMARALFQSWFVDFDPVRAKLDGPPPIGLDAATNKHFPATFQESPFGLIPQGWSIHFLSEFVDIIKGRSYRSVELAESRTALVTLKSFLRGGGYRPDGLKPFTGDYKPNQRIQPGELIVAFTDVTLAAEVIGKPALVRSDDRFDTLIASLDVGIVKPKDNGISRSFLYCLFMTKDFQAHAYSHTNGTTVLHLNPNVISIFPFVFPPRELIERFSEIADPLFRSIDETAKQSRTLATLRDTLLPKLLSGELRVSALESMHDLP